MAYYVFKLSDSGFEGFGYFCQVALVVSFGLGQLPGVFTAFAVERMVVLGSELRKQGFVVRLQFGGRLGVLQFQF